MSNNRGELLSWLMFVAKGIGPFSGQAVHFQTATAPVAYAINRYRREAERLYSILNDRLRDRAFMLGSEYSIVDMAAWGWLDRYRMVLGQEALSELPHLKRWYESINNRPAVARARSISQNIQFKTDFDEETLRSMFPQNYPKV